MHKPGFGTWGPDPINSNPSPPPPPPQKKKKKKKKSLDSGPPPPLPLPWKVFWIQASLHHFFYQS